MRRLGTALLAVTIPALVPVSGGCSPRPPEARPLPETRPPTATAPLPVPAEMLGWYASIRCTVNLEPAPQLHHLFIGPAEIALLSQDGVLTERDVAWKVSDDPGLAVISTRVAVGTAVWIVDGYVGFSAREGEDDDHLVTLYDRVTVSRVPSSTPAVLEIVFSMGQAESRGMHSQSPRLHCLAYKPPEELVGDAFDRVVAKAKSRERCELAAACCRERRERGASLGPEAPDALCAADPDVDPSTCTAWVADLKREYAEWEAARRCARSRGPEADACARRFTTVTPHPHDDRIAVLGPVVPERPYELPPACAVAFERQALGP